MAARPLPVESVRDPERAASMVHPLRRRILAEAAEPVSAAEVAGRLGLPRQRVNYHVRELASRDLLIAAGERRKGNFVERLYVATARAYVIAPEVLGPLAASPEEARDELSASRLLALAARLISELGRAAGEAGEVGQRLSTLSIDAELSFTGPAQRARFGRELRDAVAEVVARHASPPGEGRPYRLVVGCHPVPPAEVGSNADPDPSPDPDPEPEPEPDAVPEERSPR